MKKLFELWKEGWREGWYFIKFIMYFYPLLFIPVVIVDELIRGGIFFNFISLLWLFFGFPLIVHWASQRSGFRAPTKEEEALETEKQAAKVYEEIRQRNN